MSYYRKTYLRSDHWEDLRLKKLSQKDAKCCICRCRSLSNDVHHVDYKGLWDVKTRHLRVLCRSCHAEVHQVLESRPWIRTIENPAKRWYFTTIPIFTRLRKQKRKIAQTIRHSDPSFRGYFSKNEIMAYKEFHAARSWLFSVGYLSHFERNGKRNMQWTCGLLHWARLKTRPIHAMDWFLECVKRSTAWNNGSNLRERAELAPCHLSATTLSSPGDLSHLMKKEAA